MFKPYIITKCGQIDEEAGIQAINDAIDDLKPLLKLWQAGVAKNAKQLEDINQRITLANAEPPELVS